MVWYLELTIKIKTMKNLLLFTLISLFAMQTMANNNLPEKNKSVELIYSEEIKPLLDFESDVLILPLGISYETDLGKIIEIQMFNPEPERFEMLYHTPNDLIISVEIKDLDKMISYKLIFDAKNHEMTKIMIDKI